MSTPTYIEKQKNIEQVKSIINILNNDIIKLQAKNSISAIKVRNILSAEKACYTNLLEENSERLANGTFYHNIKNYFLQSSSIFHKFYAGQTIVSKIGVYFIIFVGIILLNELSVKILATFFPHIFNNIQFIFYKIKLTSAIMVGLMMFTSAMVQIIADSQISKLEKILKRLSYDTE